jgi:hypothetical protein
MAFKIRRGTNTERLTVTPAEGELIYTTDTKKIYVGDGATAGGVVVTGSGSGGGIALTDISVTDAGGDGSLAYNSSTGVFTYTGPSATEVRSHFSAGTGISISGGVISATGGGGGGIALTDLSATTATGITYNSSTGVFALASIPNTSLTNSSVTFNGKTAALGSSATINLADLGTVSISSPSNGQVLKYNGTAWVNGTDSTGGGGGIALTDISVTDAGGDGSLSYNSSTGVFTYTGPSATEVRAHFSAGTGITISSGTIATTITQYTDALARASISAGTGISYNSTTGVISATGGGGGGIALTDISVTDAGGDGSLSYNSSTGVFTYTGPSATEVRAHFTAGTGISISGGVISATGGGGGGIALTDLSATTATGITYNNSTGVFALSSIPNSSLANTSVTFNGKSAALGSSATINLADLGTVSISSPSNGQVLKYNGTAWVNGTDSTGSGGGIALTDLSVTDAGGDGSLSYNSGTGVFTYTGPSATEVRSHFTAGTGISISSGTIASTITQYTDSAADARIAAASINALSDVTVTSPTSGQVLKYNGSAWVNDTDSTGGGGAGTTYGISAETTTGGVNLRLTGSDATTDDVKLAAGSNITLTRTDASTITIASSGGGGGSSGQRLVVQVDYDASGNLTAATVLSGSGSATITDATSANALVEFTLTGFSGPPNAAVIYGYARATNLYSMKMVEATVTTRTFAAGGSSGSPNMFSAWDATVHKPKLALTKAITVASAGVGQTTHCVVIFSGV